MALFDSPGEDCGWFPAVVVSFLRYNELMPDETLAYYNTNAEAFIKRTMAADMSDSRSRFLNYVPDGGTILDLGCGAGRDSAAFLSLGYEVTAVDGSQAMCKSTADLTGLAVRCMLFDELDYTDAFDGIWACASLLHVKKCNLVSVLGKIRAALRPDGTFYASFKEGTGESFDNGRFFAYYSAEELESRFGEARLRTVDIWQTVRPRMSGDVQWINLIAKHRKT